VLFIRNDILGIRRTYTNLSALEFVGDVFMPEAGRGEEEKEAREEWEEGARAREEGLGDNTELPCFQGQLKEGCACFAGTHHGRSGNFVCNPWADAEWLRGTADVGHVIVNAGAHVMTSLPSFRRYMEAAAQFLHAHATTKGIQVLFRTAVPGHQHCDNVMFTPPLLSMEEAERFIAKGEEADNTSSYPFHWSQIKKLNEIATASFTRAGTEILDVYSSSIMRWDGHMGDGDCLHYCMGGTAYDSWVLFLQQHLQRP
jgi:hypothetical protein